MTKPLADTVDGLERRCPRLGGMVPFAYCRDSAENACPCFKVLDCWWEHFDVAAYFKARLPDADFRALLERKPKPKVASLLELIEQARKRAGHQ